MSLMRIVLDSPLSADGLKSVCDLSPGQLPALNNLEKYLGGVSGGNYMANLIVLQGAVKATGSITSTGTSANNETMTICGQTLTAKTSGAVAADGEFNISATVGTQAASIALAINSMPELVGICSAEALAGVVTVSAAVPGLIGNGLVMVDVNLGNVTVAGFSGGSDGTSYTLDLD